MTEFHSLIARLVAEPPREVRIIARESGIPYGTLRKLRSLDTTNPRVETVERLRNYYAKREAA